MDDVRAVLDGSKRWCVARGDSAEVLAALPPSSVDAVVTDPPSGIAFMGVEWDRDKGGRAQWVAWLAGILASARVATKDGGRLFAWALPRTTHWTGCAVEDAGWSVENVVTHLYATGWPKGASQLKPASEHWYLARTGRSTPLNIEACRVGTTKNVPGSLNVGKVSSYLGGAERSGTREDHTGIDPNVGRWPPNLVLSHTDRCVREGTRRVASASQFKGGAPRKGNVYGGDSRERPPAGYADPDGTETVESWRCAEGCVVAELDAQSGETYSGDPSKPKRRLSGMGAAFRDDSWTHDPTSVGVRYGDTGGASRFYPCFPADDPADPWNEALFRYVAKPSRAEKEAGVTDVDPLPADAYAAHRHRRMEGEPERFDGAPVARASNDHPTVKSVALMRWLIRLITSPGDLVLDPFGGSGTTGVAALLEGRRVILVERDERFAAIARARCEHAAPTPGRIARVAAEPVRVVAPDYGPLFGGTR